MNTIARFQTPEDAHLFRLFLDQHEIEAFLFDEYTIQNAWSYGNMIGGVRVVVYPEDVPSAVICYQEYWQTVLTASNLTPPVRAWPLVLILCFMMGGPLLFFGRHPATEE